MLYIKPLGVHGIFVKAGEKADAFYGQGWTNISTLLLITDADAGALVLPTDVNRSR